MARPGARGYQKAQATSAYPDLTGCHHIGHHSRVGPAGALEPLGSLPRAGLSMADREQDFYIKAAGREVVLQEHCSATGALRCYRCTAMLQTSATGALHTHALVTGTGQKTAGL
jgi:hypothetical protein